MSENVKSLAQTPACPLRSRLPTTNSCVLSRKQVIAGALTPRERGFYLTFAPFIARRGDQRAFS